MGVLEELLECRFSFRGPVQLEDEAAGSKRVGDGTAVGRCLGQRMHGSGKGHQLRFVDGLGYEGRLGGGEKRNGKAGKKNKDGSMGSHCRAPGTATTAKDNVQSAV